MNAPQRTASEISASNDLLPDLPAKSKAYSFEDGSVDEDSLCLPRATHSTASITSVRPTKEDDDLSPVRRKLKTVADVTWRHLSFIGPGMVASVAYIDPGNWSTDLAAGASYGYAHLFVVLMAGLFAILYQILSARLGVVSGRDLAQHCRASLHSRPKHRMFYRWGLLYPLYLLSEVAVVFTDLAEMLGSAIAINLLVPAIPLYAGVLLTGLDVFLVLFFFNSYPSETATRTMHAFEAVIGVLVIAVLGCFIALIVKVGPRWGEAFRDFLPNSDFIPNGGLYAAVGIIGATVMPHALFLGSKLATIERYAENDGDYKRYLDTAPPTSLDDRPSSRPRSRSIGPSLHFPGPRQMPNLPLPRDEDATETLDPESQPLKKRTVNPSITHIRRHVKHASIDIAFSLLVFALVINSSILILSASAFNSSDEQIAQNGDLFSAHALIKQRLGTAPAYLFALALLASGQCASITVTLSGQVISEGFLHWSIKPWIRRLVTRLISMIPSIIVAIAVGPSGLNTLLVASQVTLSIILPFIVFPLMCFTSNPKLMTIATGQERTAPRPSSRWTRMLRCLGRPLRQPLPGGGISFATPAIPALLGWAIFALVVICNFDAIVQLGMGET